MLKWSMEFFVIIHINIYVYMYVFTLYNMFVLILSISLILHISMPSKIVQFHPQIVEVLQICSGGRYPLPNRGIVKFWVIVNEEHKNALQLTVSFLENIKYLFSRHNIILFEKVKNDISPTLILVYNRNILFSLETSFDHSGKKQDPWWLISEFNTQ